MRLEAEFTTEPFHGEGEPPAHARASLEAARTAGLDCEFGPLGTTVRGDGELLLGALRTVVEAAFDNGAHQVTFQVRVDE